MAGDGSNEHANVEGHDGEHDQVCEAHTECVNRRNEEGDRDAARAEAPLGEVLNGERERVDESGGGEDGEEGEDVHAESVVAGPPGEEDLDV